MTGSRPLACLTLVAAILGGPWQSRAAGQDIDEAANSSPGQVQEIVTITATRLPVEAQSIAGHTLLLTAADLRLTAASGIDELLRAVPQFSLLRRAPARGAHPTTQGANLRGVAPSGTSRALVLLDGVPLNDAFGGWIYWSRIPQVSIERVEVALGGASAPFGSSALGGVVAATTLEPAIGSSLRVRTRAGSARTALTGLAAGTRGRAGSLLATAEGFHTDGYLAVADDAAGSIDRPTATRHLNGLVRGSLDRGLRLSLDAMTERRNNGTPAQTNRTHGFGGSIRYASDGESGSGIETVAFGRTQVFESRFSAVAADRNSERPVLDQRVPSTDLGARVLGWRQTERATYSVGVDGRWVVGRSEEFVYFSGARRDPGGSQLLGGLHLGLAAAPIRALSLQAGLRVDAWENRSREGGESRSLTALSPRLGLSWVPAGSWRLRAAAYRAFRAPTLNELYRSFRVGDVTTLPNPALGAETLFGTELGARFQSPDQRWRVDLSWYSNRLDDAVINATVRADGSLRRRANLGGARVDGIELDGRWSPGRWRLGVDAAWMRSRVVTADRDTLIGNRLPQVPDYRIGGTLGFGGADGLQVFLRAAWIGAQYEDDLNSLLLAAGTTVDLTVTYPVGRRWLLSLAAQNLLDERIEVGRTPTLVLGPPRSLAVGVELLPGPAR